MEIAWQSAANREPTELANYEYAPGGVKEKTFKAWWDGSRFTCDGIAIHVLPGDMYRSIELMKEREGE